jgi:hypothetical protein
LAEEWKIIMSAINHGTRIPTDSRREVLMGYQYALHQTQKEVTRRKEQAKEKAREQQHIK